MATKVLSAAHGAPPAKSRSPPVSMAQRPLSPQLIPRAPGCWPQSISNAAHNAGDEQKHHACIGGKGGAGCLPAGCCQDVIAPTVAGLESDKAAARQLAPPKCGFSAYVYSGYASRKRQIPRQILEGTTSSVPTAHSSALLSPHGQHCMNYTELFQWYGIQQETNSLPDHTATLVQGRIRATAILLNILQFPAARHECRRGRQSNQQLIVTEPGFAAPQVNFAVPPC